jgi:hypothetical protein
MSRAISTPIPKPLGWFFLVLLGWMMVLSWLWWPVSEVWRMAKKYI